MGDPSTGAGIAARMIVVWRVVADLAVLPAPAAGDDVGLTADLQIESWW